MGDLLNQLAHLFVQTIPTIVFLFFLVIILERLFFRPINEVLSERAAATSGALARARELASTAERKSREYEAAFQAARQAVYREREADRQLALSERDDLLHKARQQSEATLKSALAGLAQETEVARQDLEAAAQSLGAEIAESILNGTDRRLGGPA